MATINTADDLIEVLKSDDRVRSAVRRELLTEELLALPGRFDKILETQTAMLEDMRRLHQEMKSLLEITNTLLNTQGEILQDIKGIRKEQVAMSKTHESDRQEDMQVINWLRDKDALAAATKYRVSIAKHFTRLRNMRQIRCDAINRKELDDLLDNCADEQALSEFTDDELNYFPEVDLAFGVMGRREREPEFYIVVEASYTGSANDVALAVVRAKILGAITGLDTYAVVASVYLGEGAEGRVVGNAKEYLASADGNMAFWYEIVEEEVWPP